MDIGITLVGSDDGNVYKVDTIEQNGELWLISEWIETLDPIGQAPARAIRMTGLEYEKSSVPGVDYLLKKPIPKSILHGPGLPEPDTGFVVLVRTNDTQNVAQRPN